VFNSRLYCYNKEKKEVKVYLEQSFDIEECPRSIIQSFMNEEYDAEIIFKEEKE